MDVDMDCDPGTQPNAAAITGTVGRPDTTTALRSSDAAAALAALGRAFLSTSAGRTGDLVPSAARPSPPPTGGSAVLGQGLVSVAPSAASDSSDIGSSLPPLGHTDDDTSLLPTTMSPALMLSYHGTSSATSTPFQYPGSSPFFPPGSSASSLSSSSVSIASTTNAMTALLGLSQDHLMHHLRLQHSTTTSGDPDFDALSPMMLPGNGARTTGMQTPQYGHSNVASPLVLHAHRRGASPPALPPSSLFADAFARTNMSGAPGRAQAKAGKRSVAAATTRTTPGGVMDSSASSSPLDVSSLSSHDDADRQVLHNAVGQQATGAVTAAAAAAGTVGGEKPGPVTRRMALRQQKPLPQPASVKQEATVPGAAATKTRRATRRTATRSAVSSAGALVAGEMHVTQGTDDDPSHPSTSDTSPASGGRTLLPPATTDDEVLSDEDDSGDDEEDDDDDEYAQPASGRRRRARGHTLGSSPPSRVSRRPVPVTLARSPSGPVSADAADANLDPPPTDDLNARLLHLEQIIDLTALSAPPHLRDFAVQRRAFKATVNAVSAIVNEKLYKWRDMSLEDYFRTQFRISRAQVYRVVDSATVLRDLEELEHSWDYQRTVARRRLPGMPPAVATEPSAENGQETTRQEANEDDDETVTAHEHNVDSDDDDRARPIALPLPVKQRVCAAIKSCAGNKQDRQELWKTLCMRVPPATASSKDVKETWDWLVAQGRVTPKNGRRGSTLPPSLVEAAESENRVDMAAASAVVPSELEQVQATVAPEAPAVPQSSPRRVTMPPPQTKRAGSTRKRSATAATAAGDPLSQAPVAEQPASGSGPSPVGANTPDTIVLPPPPKRVRRTGPAAARDGSVGSPPRKPKGTRRRPAALATGATAEPTSPLPVQGDQMDVVSSNVSPTVPRIARASYEHGQPAGSLLSSPISVPSMPASAPPPAMDHKSDMHFPASVSPALSQMNEQLPTMPTCGNEPMSPPPFGTNAAAFSAPVSPMTFPLQIHSPPLSNMFMASPAISPSSLTLHTTVPSSQQVADMLLSPFPNPSTSLAPSYAYPTSNTHSPPASTAAATVPATLAGGPIKGTHASLIESAIATLQQLQDAGIQLEPCFNGTWVSGINQFRFRKHGEFVTPLSPPLSATVASDSASAPASLAVSHSHLRSMSLPTAMGTVHSSLGLSNMGQVTTARSPPGHSGGMPTSPPPSLGSPTALEALGYPAILSPRGLAATSTSLFGAGPSHVPSITIPADPLALGAAVVTAPPPVGSSPSSPTDSQHSGTHSTAGGMVTSLMPSPSPSVLHPHEAAVRLVRLASTVATSGSGKPRRSDSLWSTGSAPGLGRGVDLPGPHAPSPRVDKQGNADAVGASQSR